MPFSQRTPRHPWWTDLVKAIAAVARRHDPGSPESSVCRPSRLQGVISCLRLLDRVWPRPGSATAVDGEEPPSGSAAAPEEQPTPSSGGAGSGPGPATAPATATADTPTVTYRRPAPPDRSGRSTAWAWGFTPEELPGFEIRGWIGGGGMGDVFRAWQFHLDREVALKVLRPAYAADPARLARFRREAAVAARLRGAHLLPVHDVLEVRGAPVLVLPLVQGCDLDRILLDRVIVRRGEPAEGRHPWAALDDDAFLEQILPVLDQVVAAVAVLHEADVVHRDIKPSNVLIDDRGDVLLSDFGLARLGAEGSLTLPGHELGSPGFMSPEQWAGAMDVDARADLFGLGATIYRALTLELPYGKDRLATVGPSPIPPSRHQPRLSADFDAVLLTALERDRTRRYASAAEFQDDWWRLRVGQPPAAPRRRPGTLRRRQVLACGASTSLVIVAAAFPALFPTPQPDSSDEILPGIGALPDPLAPRYVSLATDPPGARLTLIPLDSANGFPLPEQAFPPRSAGPPMRLPPGIYLVVAEAPGRGFHEVYRRVPGPGETPGFFPHTRWTPLPDGVIELPRIRLPREDVNRGMVRFGQEAGPHRLSIPPFDLDPTEVTVEQYLDVMEKLPFGLVGQDVNDDDAVHSVSWDEATAFAERAGKRLPTDREFGYAATSGGMHLFPWGDEALWGPDQIWRFGPVGVTPFDRTATNPPVLGLYSNVAEWTDTWSIAVPVAPAPLAQGTGLSNRRVRGGPPSVILGQPDPDDIARGPQPPQAIHYLFKYPGLGFRCARSVRPRLPVPSAGARPK